MRWRDGGFADRRAAACAGRLLFWGHNFVTNEVSTQLVAQKIVSRWPTARRQGPEFAACASTAARR